MQVGSSLMEVLLGLGSLSLSFSISILDDIQRDESSEESRSMAILQLNIFRFYLISALFVNTIMAIFSALMLYGVNKKKANFMTPYIHFMFGMIGLAGLAAVGMAVLFIESLFIPYLIIASIVGGFSALEFYFIRVVKLHKEEVSFFVFFCDRNIRISLYNWVEWYAEVFRHML